MESIIDHRSINSIQRPSPVEKFFDSHAVLDEACDMNARNHCLNQFAGVGAVRTSEFIEMTQVVLGHSSGSAWLSGR